MFRNPARSFACTRIPVLVATAVPVLAGWGCGPQTITLQQTSTCEQPILTSVQRPARQQQGQIVISVAPDMPRCENLVQITYTPTDPPSSLAGITSALAGDQGEQFYRRIERRGLFVHPTYDFNVAFVNQSPRVFRGDGMVVAYQVDGAQTPLDEGIYSRLLGTQILPGQQRVELMQSIDHTSLTSGSTIGLFLYDVVTERTDAGEPAVRSNFEWFFSKTEQVMTGPGTEVSCVVSETDVPPSFMNTRRTSGGTRTPAGTAPSRAPYILQTEQEVLASGLACPT